MASSRAFLASFILSCFWVFPLSEQLQSSQTEVLQQLRKQLQYPTQLDPWSYAGDLCSFPPSPFLSVICEDNAITELKIIGDKPTKIIGNFNGRPIPGRTLSPSFSVDSFVTTLARLTSLKSLIMVALGIWGPLPDKIHRLDSLQLLDLSSNFLYGSIPQRISAMGMLRSLTLDSNFFNGTVPDLFGSLSNLTVLSLKNNRLTGPFPSSISAVATLTSLSLSKNNISGGLPDLTAMASLEVLDLRENMFDSGIPSMPRRIITVLLSKNSIDGEIPPQIGDLTRLQHLDLSYNLLRGNPPSSLFSLPNLSYLSLSSNMLGGSLSRKLACGANLGFVDISINRFTGSLPLCLSDNSSERVVKFNGNCLLGELSGQHEPWFCRDGGMKTGRKGKYLGLLICAIVGACLVMLGFLFVLLYLCRKFRRRVVSKTEPRLLSNPSMEHRSTGYSPELLANARCIAQAKRVGSQVMPAYRVFSLEELKAATDDFSAASLIGEGSHGTVYRGKLENGCQVAVRCLALFKKYSIRNLNLRLDLLSKLRHPHLVCLLGHCVDGSSDDSSVNRVFLVYEHVAHGNLRLRLCEKSGEKFLRWEHRLAILIGIAKATHFLQAGVLPGFFNNKLKSHNVLLNEHRVAKISDYGLSIITEEIDKREGKAETAKSSHAAQIKRQSLEMTTLDDDVFSLGLIILETLAGPLQEGKDPSVLADEMGRLEFRETMIDPSAIGGAAEESLSLVISMAQKCVSLDSSLRPSVEDVLWNLQYAAQVQSTATHP
ncbi:leucine-rich repeat protein kinase family protein isoform X2 [Wolffia australiana]